MTDIPHDTAILVVAAGRGLRAGGGVPKQYRMLAGQPVLTHTLNRLTAALPGSPVIAVIHPDDQPLFEASLARAKCDPGLVSVAHGGTTRQDSVAAGLNVVNEKYKSVKYVIIHDSVRIFLSKNLVDLGLTEARRSGASLPVLQISDSLRRDSGDGFSSPVDRTGLLSVQTPQCFRLDLLHSAHARAAGAGRHDFSDDASLVEWAGTKPKVFAGDAANFKLTTPEDFLMAEALLLSDLADIRIGHGFDVHAFADGDHVWLGGVKIAHARGLTGHSDADTGLHALTDALLGAITDGDIGMHFPPSDPRWRGAESKIFLQDAARRVRQRGGVIAHLDLTLICEEPKIGPHRDRIRSTIAEIVEIDIDRVAVKATTTEQLGFTGRREGIAAQAVATVRLPLKSPGA